MKPELDHSVKFSGIQIKSVIKQNNKYIEIFEAYPTGGKAPRISLMEDGKYIKNIDIENEISFTKLWNLLKNFKIA